MLRTVSIAAGLWVLAGCLLAAGGQTLGSVGQPGQTHFSAEDDGVKLPVRIPEDALAILKADPEVRKVAEEKHLNEREFLQKCFSAAVVHLHNPLENDLLVEGEGPLRGANVIPFWVFLDTPKGMKLVMMAPEHDLIIRHNGWHGYLMIELAAVLDGRKATNWLRFDGNRYVAYRHFLEKIK